MNPNKPEVWECEHDVEVNASPEVIWALFEDVPGWTRWNAGIEKIEIDGPFQVGAEFAMKPTGQPSVTSRLREVQRNVSFLDETHIGDLRIFVEHRIEVLSCSRSRVVFSLEAFGPSCDQVGPAVSADFPDVLDALRDLAESCLVCADEEKNT